MMRSNRAFELIVEHSSDGEVFISNEELNVFGHGRTFVAALHDLASYFDMMSKTYLGRPDSELTKDAQVFRDRLQSLLDGDHT